MKYLALLRGINVGGNNTISMQELKKLLQEKGYDSISTFINSGNVMFETGESDRMKISEKLENMIEQNFSCSVRVLVLTLSDMEKVIAHIPKEWEKRSDIRCYVSFILPPLVSEKAAEEFEIREGVDSLSTGPGVVYMTSLLSDLTKSKFNKLAAKKIYKEMTIRNYNTTKKLFSLMKQG